MRYQLLTMSTLNRWWLLGKHFWDFKNLSAWTIPWCDLIQIIMHCNYRWKRAFSKAANNWTVHPEKVKKQYEYIPELQARIAMRYNGWGTDNMVKDTNATWWPKENRTAELALTLVKRVRKNWNSVFMQTYPVRASL